MVKNPCLLVTVCNFFGAGSATVYLTFPRVVEGRGLSGRGIYPFFFEDNCIVPHRYNFFFGRKSYMRVCLLIMLIHLCIPSVVGSYDLLFVTVATSHAPYEIGTSYRKDVTFQVREAERRK